MSKKKIADILLAFQLFVPFHKPLSNRLLVRSHCDGSAEDFRRLEWYAPLLEIVIVGGHPFIQQEDHQNNSNDEKHRYWCGLEICSELEFKSFLFTRKSIWNWNFFDFPLKEVSLTLQLIRYSNRYFIYFNQAGDILYLRPLIFSRCFRQTENTAEKKTGLVLTHTPDWPLYAWIPREIISRVFFDTTHAAAQCLRLKFYLKTPTVLCLIAGTEKWQENQIVRCGETD